MLVLEKPTRQFKKTLIESLQTDSNPSYNESLELVSDEDALRAEKLLGLNLKRQEGFCKSHLEDYFKKDSVTRRNLLSQEEMSMAENISVRRHNVVFGLNDSKTHLKIICLYRDGAPAPVGQLFLGKVMESGKYETLTDQDRLKVDKFISSFL